MSNSIDPDETAHMSRLIWIYPVFKSLLLSLVAVKVKESHCCSILPVTLNIHETLVYPCPISVSTRVLQKVLSLIGFFSFIPGIF